MGRLKNTAKMLLVFMTLLGGQIIFGTPVFGVTDASISISISAPLSLNLSPGIYGSVSQTISVTTDNYTGYTATLTNSTNSTDLVNSSDSNFIIPTITLPQGSSSITQNQFTNGYGFSTNGTNFVPAPTSASDLAIGNRSSAGTGSHSLYLGILPALTTASGTYTKSFTVTVLANNPQYSITYNANAGTDTVTNMPSNISVTPSSTSTVTLSNNVPVRSGYNFLGWDTNGAVTSNPTYQPGDTITLEPTQANAINLYAIWSSASRIIHDTTTTVYSPSAVPAGYTVYFDNPNIEGNPVVTADNNGKIVSFEYTNISTNGITFNTGHSLNTGIIAFDDTGFTIHLVVKMNPRDNAGKRLVSAFQQNSGSSNYAGFTFYCYSNQYFYFDASNSASITGTSFGTHINSSGWRVQNNQEQTFTLDVTYTPAPNKSISVNFTPVRSGSSSFSSNDANTMSYIPDSLSDATIILSGNGIANNTSKDLSNAVVYEFSVTKP